MIRTVVISAIVAIAAGMAHAEPFCATTEPGVFPEDSGWERWTNDGGAQRSFEEGALVLDGMGSIYIADMYKQYLPALPVIGEEVLTVAWGLRVDEVDGFADPGVEISIDGHGDIVLLYSAARIYSLYECAWVAVFEPGLLHHYGLTSADLDSYVLSIDDVPVHTGLVAPPMPDTYVAWGDGVQGAASRSVWAYMRVTVTRPGDVNGDGVVDFADINPFVDLLTRHADDQDEYCALRAADVNQDGAVDFADINPFVEILLR
jgi:hypothetical protein